jgi:hypothetical protein
MPDPKPAFSYASAFLRMEVLAMPALTEPSDSDLPAAMLALIGAIDRVDVAYQASLAAAGLDAGVRTMTIARYLKTQREIKGLSVHDVALRLQTDPLLPFADRVEWITAIEAELTPISINNALSFLTAVRLDAAETGWLLQLIRDQEQQQPQPQPQAIVE